MDGGGRGQTLSSLQLGSAKSLWLQPHDVFAVRSTLLLHLLEEVENGPEVYTHMSDEHNAWFANERELHEANERAIWQAQDDEGLLGFGAAAAAEELFQLAGRPVPHRPWAAAFARNRLGPQVGWARDPPAPQQDFAPVAPVEMRPIGAGGRVVRRTQAEIDEELARQEGFAEFFDDEEPWPHIVERAWEPDVEAEDGPRWRPLGERL